MSAKPFIKWAGGKTQLLLRLKDNLPEDNFGRYFEPMVGGGALFFAISPDAAYISDSNSELINAYNVVKNSPEELIQLLSSYQVNKEHYIHLRSLDRQEEFSSLSVIERAARFIFLNKTCFNGLYRVNLKGQFNVPMGNSKSAVIDPDNIRLCSAALRNTTIECGQYFAIESILTQNDFVYLDPPYVPLTETSKFTEYTPGGFQKEDHIVLRDFCRRITDMGVKFLLSNADTEFSRDLYSEFNVTQVSARRSISAKNSGRVPVGEIIVKNF